MSDKMSFASPENAAYIDELYQRFLQDPNSLEDSWRQFFLGIEFATKTPLGKQNSNDDIGLNHAKVEAYVNAYRRLGHLHAKLDPLGSESEDLKDLSLEKHGINNINGNEKFHLANFSPDELTLDEIIARLKKTYCGTIGADFREVNNVDAISWLQEKMEPCLNQPELANALKIRVLHKLVQAESLEKFLHARYLGQKRFSLEGLETLIPLLDMIISGAKEEGCEEVCIGMAHRGRLNVLTNILEKPYERIFFEFNGSDINPFDIDGDVKYHLGFGNEVECFKGGKIKLFLAANPSHLEAVNPVVEGFSRARQDSLVSQAKEKVLPVLLHGDAAFIGQGVVAETLNLAGLSGYSTKGTIHIITNNQIGFTTDVNDSRSCTYSSDICKVIRAPVFHVNADDPNGVAWVAMLAVQYRNTFKKDVVIDLIGYRRHGHNETDEPGFTQPLLYKKIEKHPSVVSLYSEKLIANNVLSKEQFIQMENTCKALLQKAYDEVRSKEHSSKQFQIKHQAYSYVFNYRKIDSQEIFTPVNSSISLQELEKIGKIITSTPDAFAIHPKLKRIYANRAQMVEHNGMVDWAFAELLAFASLAKQGFAVRLSGQDCKRGTFSSRHGVLFDYDSGKAFEPLNQLGASPITIINSPLSEQGCLGFEFGYSLANPKTLVLWEAQFGDFVNGAQIIIDQFLTASEAKWQITSGLILLLPHGYEGQGPEHSSARPERFLQSCGNFNIQVCNVTTPAQLFHLLRRQMLRSFRKPLILLTPKSLLRHPQVISPIGDFTQGGFLEVLRHETALSKDEQRLLLCSGKIFYELIAAQEKHEDFKNIPILRLEQIYPFPKLALEKILLSFPKLKELVWVQEEPENMASWFFVRPLLSELLPSGVKLSYIGRKSSGSTAEGSSYSHKLEQARIVDEALGLVCGWQPGVKRVE